MSAPPIREPWKTDKTGKLVSLPWILWLQNLSSSIQTNDEFSGVLALFSSAETSIGTGPASDDVAALEGMMYNPSSSTASPNDAEMLLWMSF